MRLWSLHPKYLDKAGLVSMWREALLAKKVLQNQTRGYKRHPQLKRFKEKEDPLNYINLYLHGIFEESITREYIFDQTKIGPFSPSELLPVTEGQMEFEWSHLLEKFRTRSPKSYDKVKTISTPEPHPLFKVVPGTKESWEGKQIMTEYNRPNKVLSLLNEMIKVLKPIKYNTFNVFLEAKRKDQLLDLEQQEHKLEVSLLNPNDVYKEENPWGVSTMSIVATITDFLIDKRLGVKLDDDGVLTEFIFVEKPKKEKKPK